jgi:hypothetical protein
VNQWFQAKILGLLADGTSFWFRTYGPELLGVYDIELLYVLRTCLLLAASSGGRMKYESRVLLNSADQLKLKKRVDLKIHPLELTGI